MHIVEKQKNCLASSGVKNDDTSLRIEELKAKIAKRSEFVGDEIGRWEDSFDSEEGI